MNLTHSHLEELADMKGIIKELETEINSMRDQRDKLQEENMGLIEKSYQDDYRVENMKKRINYFVEQVEKFETENKLLRKLVKEWA